MLGILAAIAVPTFDTLKKNSAKGTAQATAQSIARNADAIAASSGTGAAVSNADLDTAIGEADIPGLDAWTAGSSDVVYTTTISGIGVDCTFTLGDLETATSVSCAVN